jgi:hypothetical protein
MPAIEIESCRMRSIGSGPRWAQPAGHLHRQHRSPTDSQSALETPPASWISRRIVTTRHCRVILNVGLLRDTVGAVLREIPTVTTTREEVTEHQIVETHHNRVSPTVSLPRGAVGAALRGILTATTIPAEELMRTIARLEDPRMRGIGEGPHTATEERHYCLDPSPSLYPLHPARPQALPVASSCS